LPNPQLIRIEAGDGSAADHEGNEHADDFLYDEFDDNSVVKILSLFCPDSGA